MIVDISPLIQGVVVVVGAVLTVTAPVMANLIAKKLHLDANAQALGIISRACSDGAGLAYSALVTESRQPASIDIKSAALAVGIKHVMTAVPLALAHAGVTEETVAGAVAGKLGHILAQDASVTAGASASSPPPSPAGVLP